MASEATAPTPTPVITITDSASTTSTPVPGPPAPPKPSYGSVSLTLDNVLLPPEKLTPSPSSLDGLDEDTESFLRVAGCELIQTSGILLKLPQTAMATGQVLFQRFYYSKSFVRQAMETTAMACIYLASKIEEAPRRIRDVINVFHHIRQYRASKVLQPLILDQAYIRLKGDVTLAERRILKELGFCVHVKHPHKIIVIYLQQLGYYNNQAFVQMSWNFMNDALRTNVFVRFKPEAIACACIFLSARKLKIALPNRPAWYLVFDVTDEEVVEISTVIMELYERPPVDYEVLEKKVDDLAKAYQEMRQKGRTSILTMDDKSKELSTATIGTSDTQSPDSRPPSPGKSKASANSKEETINNSTKTDKDQHKRTSDRDRDHINGTTTNTSNSSLKPPPEKRKPSPIIFNNNEVYDDRIHHRSISPTTNRTSSKHKKRNKKSRCSSSRSRSRSPKRNISSKKYNYRDESPPAGGVGARKHHKKKSHHTRYSNSPSRSRSRDRIDRDRDHRGDRERDRGDRRSAKKLHRDRERERESRDRRERSRSPLGYYSSHSVSSTKRKYYD